MKTITITAAELRGVVNYMDVVTEKLYDVDGWTDIEQVNRSEMGGVEVTELRLYNRYVDDDDVQNVCVRYYGINDSTPDDKAVVDIEID
ncbi:hypothetical protein [Parageobacillus thermoglucosidasius]|uniref:hypothetical protein n=1 Tax=Parageobacillus thermoglucosidasius TaxID=1426 RepID=UPI002E24E657|nr:hypothetical protein [Parageobacillus thermoglucosidasius]MED4946519.1 hypothetical protein [Parageobacillus thermoglucosidasius]MED4984080.1 hypothetical protein [Parageobacillus thermoglucosidasius]